MSEQLSKQWFQLKSGSILVLLGRHSDLLLPLGLILAMGFLFFPIPAPLISTLVVLNIAISFTVLATSLYMSSPVQLTSYPTILLLTTLLRLCLSVAITRRILDTGDAGAVIKALGEVTAAGNIIIGAIIFLMIMVVQFIIVAKGSERAGEVAARFTLDAMHGKQMAIDADLHRGLITQDQARELRAMQQKESQLYAALDGGMKFVKGDAIATMIIAMINIIGGLAIGHFKRGMSLGAAAEKYTILTIGDGLAAIISSMLITISAGIVITRVAVAEDRSNVGADISQQFLTNYKPLMITAGLLFMLGLLLTISGSTASIFFFLVGGAVGVLAYSRYRAQQAAAMEEAERMAQTGADPELDELVRTLAEPMAVVVSQQLSHLIDSQTESGARFRARIPKLRSAIYHDLGVMLPHVYVLGNAPKLKSDEYSIFIKELPVAYGKLKPDCVYVNDSAENIKVLGLDGEDMPNPADSLPGAWIPSLQRSLAERAGLQVWEPAEVITLHLSQVMKKYAHEFIGIQEAQAYLDFAAQQVPKLVEEVVSKDGVSIRQFTDVLQHLVQEGISIRDIKSILDALSECGHIEQDSVLLTEYVRASMKRYITFRYASTRDTLFYYLLDQDIEDVIRNSIRRTSTGSFLALDPEVTRAILDGLRREFDDLPPTAQKPVIITEMELRRFVRNLVELEFPTLTVLSYQEVAPEVNLQVIGHISMRPGEWGHFRESGEGEKMLPPADMDHNY